MRIYDIDTECQLHVGLRDDQCIVQFFGKGMDNECTDSVTLDAVLSAYYSGDFSGIDHDRGWLDDSKISRCVAYALTHTEKHPYTVPGKVYGERRWPTIRDLYRWCFLPSNYVDVLGHGSISQRSASLDEVWLLRIMRRSRLFVRTANFSYRDWWDIRYDRTRHRIFGGGAKCQ